MASRDRSAGPPFSLRAHLINWLLTPLFVLWLFSTIAGYVATLTYANKPYDQVLLQRAQAVGAQLRLGGGRERLDLDLKLPDGSSASAPDKLVYTVCDGNGRTIVGTANLCRPLALRGGKIEPLFYNGEREGQKTRMISLVFFNPDSNKLYQLYLAETINQRQELIRGILANIVIPQLLLILIAVAAIWYALTQGLAPLERLRSEVRNRRRDDLSELDASEAPEEVHPLIEAVNDLLSRLQQAMQAQKRFIADAAHQLRTPIAGLKTQAELALRTDDPEQTQQTLQHILTSTKHGMRLVNQLMTLARNEPGELDKINFVPMDINQLAQECTANWIPAALDKDIDLGFESAAATEEVIGDATSLGEMLNNLIDNAIRYTQRGGRITVSVATTPLGILLGVEDNGPGIDPQHRERVFERFYRVLGTGQSGSGLGLAIVAEVAKRHQATMRLDAGSGGKGTLISVLFPRRAPPPPPELPPPPGFFGGA